MTGGSPNRDISTASLTDALGRLTSTPLHVIDLVSPTPGRVLRGRAATIRFVPFREDAFDPEKNVIAPFFYEAIPDDPSETVLVLDSGGSATVSLGGSVKYSRVHNWHLAGLITGARLRDFAELATYDPVFYAAGETVKAGPAHVMPVEAGVPVVLGGVTVFPGDWIHADGAGAVVIPPGLVDEAYRLAAEIDEVEAAAAVRIRDEERPAR